MDNQRAEIIAIHCVEWLAKDDQRLERFLATTGVDRIEGRSLKDLNFLGAALDHILSWEQAVIEFCEFADLPLEAPAEARQLLPGGEVPHWT